MSADDDFLARWSRRKQEAVKDDAAKVAPPVTHEATPDAAAAGVAPQSTNGDPDPKPETFDPASLPSIDSISALSDVRDFLRAGVPPELTRAALRRVWSLDPAIRDFVGLAENAWDFTDPNAMPGFGPLDSNVDVTAMVERILSGVGTPAELQPAHAQEFAVDAGSPDNLPAAPPDDASSAREMPDEKAVNAAVPPSVTVDVAPQHRRIASADERPVERRSHGGALPH